jgi:hypothetical protein
MARNTRKPLAGGSAQGLPKVDHADGLIASEITPNDLQAQHLARRFFLDPQRALLIAQLAYATVPL